MFLRSCGREPVDDPVVELDELAEHVAAGPRVAGIVAAGEPPFGEVDRDPGRPGREALADVLLALVAQIAQELLARVARDLAVERIEQRQHRGRDHRLLHRLGRHLDRLCEIVGGVGLVPERAAGQARQLAVMAVGEDREILAVAARWFGARPVPARVSVERIGGEARCALLAVGDDRRAGRLHPLDRSRGRQRPARPPAAPRDLAGVVGRNRRLKLGRPRQRADRFRWDEHRNSTLDRHSQMPAL